MMNERKKYIEEKKNPPPPTNLLMRVHSRLDIIGSTKFFK